jgi:hypothetical protein
MGCPAPDQMIAYLVVSSYTRDSFGTKRSLRMTTCGERYLFHGYVVILSFCLEYFLELDRPFHQAFGRVADDLRAVQLGRLVRARCQGNGLQHGETIAIHQKSSGPGHVTHDANDARALHHDGVPRSTATLLFGVWARPSARVTLTGCSGLARWLICSGDGGYAWRDNRRSSAQARSEGGFSKRSHQVISSE